MQQIRDGILSKFKLDYNHLEMIAPISLNRIFIAECKSDLDVKTNLMINLKKAVEKKQVKL
ncbi:MAG: hypothetical protein MHPSP_002773, partial [Paramarteilia canceri]